MKKGIIVSSLVLSNAFKEASKVKPDKYIPVTDSFLLECTPDKVYLTRTNLFDTVKVELPCESNFEGSVLLDVSVGKLMAKVDHQPVQINFNEDNLERIEVSGENFHTSIEVDHPQDYITHEKKKFESIGSMDYKEFRDILEKLTPFLAKDELRPAMCGYCFDKEMAAATNAHMVRAIPYSGLNIKAEKAQLKEFQKKDEIILRPNVFTYLPKKIEGKVNFSVDQNHYVKIEFDGHVIISKLINEPFPNFRDVIPTEFVTEFSLLNVELRKTIEQALIFANTSTSQITFDVKGDNLKVSSADLDYNRDFERTLEYQKKDGEDMLFAVNGKLLLECIKHLDSEVTFQLKAPNVGIMLNGEVLIMPVLVN